MVITPYMNDGNPSYVKAVAEKMGVTAIAPEGLAERSA